MAKKGGTVRPVLELPHTLRGWILLMGAVGLAITTIALYINLPIRMREVEAGVEALEGWAKELQGYTKAQQEYNQSWQNQAVYPPAQRSLETGGLPRSTGESRRRENVHPPVEPEVFVDYDQDSGECWVCQAQTEEQCWQDSRWTKCR